MEWELRDRRMLEACPCFLCAQLRIRKPADLLCDLCGKIFQEWRQIRMDKENGT